MRPSRLEGPAITVINFLVRWELIRAWRCEALAVFSMDVTVVGVNELPVFTVISDSNVDAVAGNHLGFGLQPRLHVVSSGTALIQLDEPSGPPCFAMA